MKVGVSRYVVYMTKDDQFITGIIYSGGKAEIYIITYVKL